MTEDRTQSYGINDNEDSSNNDNSNSYETPRTPPFPVPHDVSQRYKIQTCCELVFFPGPPIYLHELVGVILIMLKLMVGVATFLDLY